VLRNSGSIEGEEKPSCEKGGWFRKKRLGTKGAQWGSPVVSKSMGKKKEVEEDEPQLVYPEAGAYKEKAFLREGCG